VSNQALYRKYRSASLKEVVGQEHIVSVLDAAIKQDKISHAYLFTGPKGVGKTSIARIFAHEINKAEYSSEKTHLDIIEIDAASNSGVDDMRDLKEKITSAPAQLQYKIYIIDEVHMLSGASFAALLKTIEEPPSHAIFILATTDAHKVPATIMSRVQKFYFKPIELNKIEEHLTEVCKKEKIKFETEALKVIAESSEGSMRDALSLLDQVASGNKEVSLKSVQSSLGLANDKGLKEISKQTIAGELSEIPSTLEGLIATGTDPRALAYQIYQQLKSQLTSYEDLQTLGELLTLGSLAKPALGLELILLKLASRRSNSDSPKKSKEEAPKAAIAAVIESDEVAESITVTNKEVREATLAEDKEDTDPAAIKLTLKNLSEKWADILDIVYKKSASLKAVLKPSSQKLTEKTYTLDINLAYPMHLKMAQDSKNKKLLLDAFKEAGLQLPQLNLVLGEKKINAKKEQQKISEDNNNTDKAADFSDIIGLMGGGEPIKL
jgi:DNA polymerase-3 subunit gamma/tau